MKIESIKFRLNNIQKGVYIIRNSILEKKTADYVKEYQKETIGYKTNINIRTDLALESLCRDKVIEGYLYSKQYHFDRIGVLINPFHYAPMSAILLIYSKDPAIIKFKVQSSNEHTIYKDVSSLKKYHRISVTGLENGKNYIYLTMCGADGKEISKRKIFLYLNNIQGMTPSPIVKCEVSKESSYPQILITGGEMNPFVFNSNGSIMHYMQFKNFRTSPYGVYSFTHNKYLWPVRSVGAPSYANPHSPLLYEMDFMGRISRTYHVKNGIHHYVQELPNGNFVTCSSSGEHYSGNRIAEGHTEDIIIEIERETGKIIRTIYLKDIFGDKYCDQVDWVHANYLEYNEDEDTMMICMRNIHAVIKLNWTTLEVVWLLSLPKLWEDTPLKDKVLVPQGEVFYSFQAHAAYEVKDYQYAEAGYRYYLIFDNHRLNRRPIEGYSEDGHSYVNIYAVNEAAGMVKQIKHLQIDMSIVRSNARYDSKANHIFNMSGCMWRDNTEFRGKVEEYDYDTDELINAWYINDDFFSGYSFKWKSDDYCNPLSITKKYQYECGEADCLEPVHIVAEETGEKADRIYFNKPFVEENYLYFFTKDHSIDAFLLIGEKNSYGKDYSDTWQTKKIHIDRKYYCVLSLMGLEPDRYQVKIEREGKIYDTGYYIQIL